jgi:hypothetical protein
MPADTFLCIGKQIGSRRLENLRLPETARQKKRGRLRPNPSRPGPLGLGGVALLPLPHADTDGRSRFRSGGGARRSGPAAAGGAAPDSATLCPDPMAALEVLLVFARDGDRWPSGGAGDLGGGLRGDNEFTAAPGLRLACAGDGAGAGRRRAACLRVVGRGLLVRGAGPQAGGRLWPASALVARADLSWLRLPVARATLRGWLRLVLSGLAAALPLPSASVAGWRHHHGGGVWGG